jgi:integrase
MAVYKLNDKPRKLPWCADYYVGDRRRRSMFRTEDEAKHCEASELTSIRSTGLPARKKELEPHTVREIVEDYRDDKAPANLGYNEDLYRLNGFLKHDICKESLFFVKKKHAEAYVKDRLRDHQPSTVRREVNLWYQVFAYAIRKNYENLSNIWAGIKIKGSKARRERRLIEEARELQRLLAACDSCRGRNKYYVDLAIKMLIGTGMRKEELFNLRWEDISVVRRHIKIRKSKMDYKRTYKGRTIALPLWCMNQLLHLVSMLKKTESFNLKDRVFPMTLGAFSQAFANVRDQAKITDLHIHDLRHEAASQFDEMGLSKPQRDHMLGHSPEDQGDRYVHATNKAILKTLDNHWLAKTGQKKKTDEEFEEYEEKLQGATWEGLADTWAEFEAEKEQEWKRRQQEDEKVKEREERAKIDAAIFDNILKFKRPYP